MNKADIDFRVLFESVPGLYLILDEQLAIVAVNDAYAQATMTRREAIIGRGLFEVFPDNPDDTSADGVSNLLASLNFVRKNKKPHTMAVQKYDIRRPDGTFEVRYWSPKNSPVLDKNKNIAYIIHRVEDVTEFIKTKNEKEETLKITEELRHQVEEMGMDIFNRSKEIQLTNKKLLAEIEERKKTEIKLNESEEIFSTFFYKSPVINSITDAVTGKFLKVNDNFIQFCGMEEKDIIGKTALDLNLIVHPEHREEVIKSIKKNGYTRDVIMEIKSKNGETKWVSTSAHQVNISERDCFLTAMIDITERKKAELLIQKMNTELEHKVEERSNEILKNEKKFRALIEKNADMMTLALPDGKLIYASPSLQSVLGYTFEEIQKIPAPDLIHPEDVPGLMEQIMDIIGTPGKSFYRQHRLLHKDGRYIWCEGTMTNMLHDPDIGALVSNFRDISERKKAEENIEQSEKKFRALIESSHDGIGMLNEKGVVMYVTPSAAKIDGFSSEDLIGKVGMGQVHPDDMPNAMKMMEDSFKNPGIPVYSQHRILHKKGHWVWTEGTMTNFLHDPAINSMVVNFRDITQRKVAELELSAQNRQLLTMNRELEQFAYVASHDLQEPLRSLISFTDLLKTEYKDLLDKKGEQYLIFIQKSSKRMQQLVKDLLDYSRIGKEKELVSVNCNELLEEVVSDISFSVKESHAEVTVNNLPVINGYKTELRQLFQNLLSNSIKFSLKDKAPVISVSAIKQDKEWIFSVTDNGIGISADDQYKIFVIFKRLHNRNEFEGNGIGLAHCKKIVEMHGGHIWVISKPGEGSTFNFTIPQL